MTIHSAKGLEFKNVFVVGLEENLFPSSMSMDSMRGLEEERRLFYVAITRAEEHCYLSFAKSRFKFGKTELSSPSRFLKDIDVRYLSMPTGEMSRPSITQERPERPKVQIIPPVQQPRILKKVSSIAPSRPAASPSVGALQAGNVIEHERFGIGDVISVVGTGDNCKATVHFRNVGEKQLLLKFAKFKVIG